MAQVPGSQHTTNISIGSKSKSIVAGWDMDEELEAIRDEDPLYPNWIEYTEYSPKRIEVMQSAQSDLAVLKKMKSSLRDTGGCKTLHLEFGIALHLLEDDDNIEVDLPGVEIPGFHVDKLIVKTVGIYPRDGPDIKAPIDKMYTRIGTELKRLNTILVGKDCRLTLNTNKESWKDGWLDEPWTSITTPWVYEVQKVY
jgi:hypothetical protein